MKPKVAVIRGAFLNRYEMQFYEPLINKYDITAFASKRPFHDKFDFPVVKLPCPLDLPEFPYKMPVLNRIFTDAHYLFGLTNKLKGYDIVHTAETYYRFTQQALDAKKQGYTGKVIATVLENIPFNNEGIPGRKKFKERARMELDHIIALTQKTKTALLSEGADPSKISVIGHFIDTKRFMPGARQRKLISDSGLRNIRILFSGRLEEYKGVMDILEAAVRLKKDPDLKGYTLKYIFCGKGSCSDRMHKFEYEAGLDRSVSHITEVYDGMPEVYRNAEIFVAPSKPTATWEEQYNTALLEAQSSGLPIVTTDSGGIPENVGSAAVIVLPGDVAGLTSAIKQYVLSAGKRREFTLKARKRALFKHDIHIGASKLSALYDELIS